MNALAWVVAALVVWGVAACVETWWRQRKRRR